MAKRIKKITKQKEITADIAFEIDEALRKETSDRTTALIAAAYVDLRLQFAIEKRMVDDESITDKLFVENGPLHLFSAKIYAAYALGILKEITFSDLKLIHDIRNAFAHTLNPLTFATPEIEKLCSALRLPTKVRPMAYGAYSPWPPSSPRDLYLAAATILTNGLFTEAVRHERQMKEPYYLKF